MILRSCRIGSFFCFPESPETEELRMKGVKMEAFQNALYPVICKINEVLSNKVLVFLLVGTGLLFTIRTRFVQIRCFKEGFRRLFSNISLRGKKSVTGMSSFQALATAVAAQVGTGNIVGASGAILTGGPGAIFWMWVIAFFGMATIYAEATLAIKTRQVDAEGKIHGGPVYYITTAFKGPFGRFLAGFFAISIIIALGLIGCMVQSNSIGSTMQTAFGVPAWIIGTLLVIICGIIFLGEINRIASVAEKIVPIMAVLFLVGGIIILLARIKYVPATFGLIFKYAFKPQAIIGGSFGYAIKTAISQGAKRGLFSNEAGMGSTPHAHALAEVKHPHEQGTVAFVGLFIDTFVVLTLNALVIINTLYVDGGLLAEGVIPETIGKANLAQTAFGTVFGASIGAKFVAVCLLFFAFSTVLSWNLFGKINVQWLFGRKNEKAGKTAVVIYILCSLTFVLMGTLLSNDLVWELQDMFNNLIVLPNAIALIALSGMVKKSCDEVRAKKKEKQ